MAKTDDLTIRYAATDADVVAIHGFLCIVFGPTLPGPIDPKDSATEVWRVVTNDVAIMAMRGDTLVGTFGILQPKFWWNTKLPFLAGRWLAVIPGSKALRPLLKEGRAIARASDQELHIYDEARGRLIILNKSKKRGAAFAPA